jgi:polysaccharide biosynthesis protein PslJ
VTSLAPPAGASSHKSIDSGPQRQARTLAISVARPVMALNCLAVGYPIWWLLGVQWATWPVVGIVLTGWLAVNRHAVRVEVAQLPWLGFLAWVAISGLLIDSGRYGASYAYRLTMYASVAAIGLFAFTAARLGLGREVLVRPLLWLWGYSVVLGMVGILVPSLQFNSLMESLLPETVRSVGFIRGLTHPAFAEFDDLYGVSRPSALYPYTNDWGAAVSILTPVAVYGFATAKSAKGKALIAAIGLLSVVAVVVSINRGCWLSLTAAFAYVVVRRLMAGQLRFVIASAVAAAALLALVVVTPLGSIAAGRFATANTDTRQNLYQASWELASKSPLFGYGAPQSSVDVRHNNGVSVGTHGQFWTVLVSQGFVGLAWYLGAILTTSLRVRPLSRGPDVWLHAACLVLLVQSLFYDSLPVPLFVFSLCAAVLTPASGHQKQR